MSLASKPTSLVFVLAAERELSDANAEAAAVNIWTKEGHVSRKMGKSLE